MEKVLGVYRITYPKYGVTQVKNLISHAHYESIYKAWNERKQELELEISSLNRKKHADKIKELSTEVKNIKTKLLNLFGSEFFTDESPIWLSQKCDGNMLLSPWQGSVIEVELEQL
jgi:hypothetical protein